MLFSVDPLKRSHCFVLLFLAAIPGACNESSPVVSADASAGASPADASTDAARELDAGGPLSRPLSCPGAGVVREPFPDSEIFEALRVKTGLDFLERRAVESTDASAPWPPLSLGTACAGASDSSQCTNKLAAISSGGEILYPSDLGTFLFSPKGFYFAFSRGDTVGKISSLSELRALTPVVDSAVAALLYAEASSYRVECTTDWFRAEPDGFVVLASKRDRNPCYRDRVVLFIGQDATIEVRDKISSPAACL